MSGFRIVDPNNGTVKNFIFGWSNATKGNLKKLPVSSSFVRSFVRSFVQSFIHPFIHSIHPFIHSFIHPFIHPFIHSSIQPSIHPSIYPSHSPHNLLVRGSSGGRCGNCGPTELRTPDHSAVFQLPVEGRTAPKSQQDGTNRL